MFYAFNMTLNFEMNKTLKSKGLELLSFCACFSHNTEGFDEAFSLSYV